ncbi:DUF3846 domain-containing protein [Ruminococcus sp.]|uniref:DUF3846 domain-containing protein n=1 Tax=Ruminococcus sp. TaxID=41978 RepID=UPI002E783CA0|nr:DUF3846 domain-containing protein [Ruminococcus sp.]MEE1261625.1 DUF3846 domain-containing protein [Ruminococcus sp.]MEE3334534.1 DUF3846 domain-containing protein [Ruminococcus sp.]
MNINIYQIDTSRDRKRICFFGLDEIKELTGEDTLNSGIYDKIFSGDVDCNNLEAVYRMFNTDHPEGYTGRSLSVSDVVEITDSDKKGFYFCDNIGFQKINFDSSLCKDLTATEKLSVLLIQPGKAPRMVEIPDTLDAMQELVGGYIEEYMPFDDEVAIIVNEEGKLNGLPPNRAIFTEDGKQIADVLVGDFFIVKSPVDSDKYQSLPKDLAKKYAEKFKYPERFYRQNGEIKVHQIKPKERSDAR